MSFILEKVTNDNLYFYVSECKHLRSLLNSKDFEGTNEERMSLTKSLRELEQEFCNPQSTIKPEDRKAEWTRRYSAIKLCVYRAYGYTSKNRGLYEI